MTNLASEKRGNSVQFLIESSELKYKSGDYNEIKFSV